MNKRTGEIRKIEDWPKEFVEKMDKLQEVQENLERLETEDKGIELTKATKTYIESLLTGPTRPIIIPVSSDSLSRETLKQLRENKKGFITKNTTCPCGSGKKFKRCCMVL